VIATHAGRDGSLVNFESWKRSNRRGHREANDHELASRVYWGKKSEKKTGGVCGNYHTSKGKYKGENKRKGSPKTDRLLGREKKIAEKGFVGTKTKRINTYHKRQQNLQIDRKDTHRGG